MVETKFKDSELGLIPEDWEVKKLEELVNNYTGLTYQPSDVNDYGVLVLRSSNVCDGQLCFKDNVYVNMKVPTRAIVKRGDILICVRNGSKHLIGKSAIISHKVEGMAFGAFMTILRNKSANNINYIFYTWQSSFIQSQIDESLGATINQITDADLKRYIIPLPSNISEQAAIATALNDVDHLITALDKKIEKKKLIKQGVMQQLLTGKKRLPGFTGKWVEKRLCEFCHFVGGGTPDTQKKEYWNGNIPWISSSDISMDDIYNISISRFITLEAVKNSATFICPPNTILLITRVGVGKLAISERLICTSQDFTNIIVLDANERFVALQLQTIMKQNKENTQGTSIKGITMEKVKELIITLPPTKEEQSAIAAILSDMDKEIEVLEVKRDKFKTIKQGMMQKLLTGQIRLIQ